MAIITEEIGDIFSAPPNSILIHACNARGAWGSGVAVAFKRKYPYAFRRYNAHCLSALTSVRLTVKQHQAGIVGTALLIPPSSAPTQGRASKTPHYIACLFTSLGYGKKVSPPEEVLENTKSALRDFARQVVEIRCSGEEKGNCYAVRINSGRFGVEWEKTKAVMEAGDLDITVVRPEEEEKVEGAGSAAGGKVERLPLKGQEVPAGIDTKGKSPRASDQAKARDPIEKQLRGVKRKAEKDPHENDDHESEETKETKPVRPDPGIAK